MKDLKLDSFLFRLISKEEDKSQFLLISEHDNLRTEVDEDGIILALIDKDVLLRNHIVKATRNSYVYYISEIIIKNNNVNIDMLRKKFDPADIHKSRQYQKIALDSYLKPFSSSRFKEENVNSVPHILHRSAEPAVRSNRDRISSGARYSVPLPSSVCTYTDIAVTPNTRFSNINIVEIIERSIERLEPRILPVLPLAINLTPNDGAPYIEELGISVATGIQDAIMNIEDESDDYGDALNRIRILEVQLNSFSFPSPSPQATAIQSIRMTLTELKNTVVSAMAIEEIQEALSRIGHVVSDDEARLELVRAMRQYGEGSSVFDINNNIRVDTETASPANDTAPIYRRISEAIQQETNTEYAPAEIAWQLDYNNNRYMPTFSNTAIGTQITTPTL